MLPQLAALKRGPTDADVRRSGLAAAANLLGAVALAVLANPELLMCAECFARCKFFLVFFCGFLFVLF